MEYFTKQQLLDEVFRNIDELCSFTESFRSYKSPNQTTIDGESIRKMPMIRKFDKLYDLVFAAEWDWLGGFHQPIIFIQDTKDLIELSRTYGLRMGIGSTEFVDYSDYVARVAVARFKYERDSLSRGFENEDLTLEEVAILANMDPQSVRNAASRGEFKTYENENVRYSDYDDLEIWMQKRRGFRELNEVDSLENIDPKKFEHPNDLYKFVIERCKESSISSREFIDKVGLPAKLFLNIDSGDTEQIVDIGRDQWLAIANLLRIDSIWFSARVLELTDSPLFWNLPIYQLVIYLEDKMEERKEKILVPVTGDNTYFVPALKRRKGFLIGSKGKEQYVEDYFNALQQLKEMQTPYWRRPSPISGSYSIVKGINWIEVSKENIFHDLKNIDGE